MNILSPVNRAERLERLKNSLQYKGLEQGQRVIASGHSGVDRALGGGVRTGALHEIFQPPGSAAGNGFAALMLHLLLQHKPQQKHLLWVRQDYAALEQGDVYAPGFRDLGLDPSFFILMRAADAAGALRAGLEGLSSPALAAVVLEIPGEPKILDLSASRRLVLAAQQHGVTIFLLRASAAAMPSACETRWRIEGAPSTDEDDWGLPVFAAELQRNRRGNTGHWVMEWNGEDFGPKTHPGLVAAASSDRSHPAWEGERRRA